MVGPTAGAKRNRARRSPSRCPSAPAAPCDRGATARPPGATSADGLDDPEADQDVQAPGQAAERRARGEADEREAVDALEAVTVAEPAADRHHDSERQGVGGRDPLHLVGGGAEVRLHPGDGDVDDVGVEDRHEHADHQNRQGQHPPAIGDGGLRGGRVRLGDPRERRDLRTPGTPAVGAAPGDRLRRPPRPGRTDGGGRLGHRWCPVYRLAASRTVAAAAPARRTVGSTAARGSGTRTTWV